MKTPAAPMGLFVALPYLIVPFFFPLEGDADLPWTERYYLVSNVWVAIFSFVGNYFWTHYFYTVLGASYSFP